MNISPCSLSGRHCQTTFFDPRKIVQSSPFLNEQGVINTDMFPLDEITLTELVTIELNIFLVIDAL